MKLWYDIIVRNKGYSYKVYAIIFIDIEGGNHMSKEVVLDWMKKADKPVGVADIAKLSGLEKDVVQKAFDQLKKEGAIISPVRCKYEPKK